MPWCDHCDLYVAPNALQADGTCATCGQTADTADMTKAATAPVRAPWHFWVMVVALVAYLGWRLLQGFSWAASLI